MTVEEHFSEAVDLLAANPNLTVDPRAWRQLFIYAPLLQYRNTTIEECARVAEMVAPIGYPEIAAAIRALKG